MAENDNWMQEVNEDIKRRGTAGLFTKKAKRHGKSVHEYAKEVVRKYKGKPDLSPQQKTLLKEAVLALTYERIAKERKYGHGGKTQGYRDEQDESLGMRTGSEASKKQSMKARREDSYGKWGKRDAEDRKISMAHGGKTQGYDDEQDESLGMRTGKESSKTQNYKARREDSYGKWGKRSKEDRDITMKKGGKTQGYNAQLDESLGMRTGTDKTQSYKARRDESKGANKHLGRRAYASVEAMDEDDRLMMAKGGKLSSKAVKEGYIRRDRYDKLKKDKDEKIDDLKKDLKEKGADCYEDIKTMKKDIGKTVAKRIDQVEKQKSEECEEDVKRRGIECRQSHDNRDSEVSKEKNDSLILGGIGGLLLGIFLGRQ